ncbi:hypothetical protein LINPERHAP1_LOCUS21950 [Linum perenne]
MIIDLYGSVRRDSGLGTEGGLIREVLGHCSLAFAINLGKCYITRSRWTL